MSGIALICSRYSATPATAAQRKTGRRAVVAAPSRGVMCTVTVNVPVWLHAPHTSRTSRARTRQKYMP